MNTDQIKQLRRDTPGCGERIHFNNAGASLMPAPVLDAIREHLELESRIGGYEAEAATAVAIDASYAAVAELLGAQPRNIAFVENATVAYAQALSSIPWQSGDVILTSEDDYISNQIMFLSLAGRFGVEVIRSPVCEAGGVDVEAMVALMDQHKPRLVALTHIPTNSGLVQPVEVIGKACRERELLYLVDACQSVGQRVVDVERIGCDFLSATSRKFLRGPRGAGFLFVSDRVLESGMEPLFLDMRGARWVEANIYQPVDSAKRFENWEFSWALVLGTGAAARYALSVGMEAIQERVVGLAADLRGQLERVGFRVLDRGKERGGIVTVHLPGADREDLMAGLRANRINANLSFREFAVMDFDRKQAHWALRLSPHYYNTSEEIDQVQRFLAENHG